MKSLFRPFPLPLSPRQVFYLGILQGLGAGFIDGGANFAVAYAMYHGQSDVRMWVFSKNTIAGDLGVTPIIQCLASMLITSTLVHTDLHHHAISPLPYVYPHVEHLPDPRSLFSKGKEDSSTSEKEEEVEKGRKKGLRYFYWMFIRFVFEGTEKNMMLAKIPIKNWFGRLIWTIAQGAAIGVLFGFPIWCLAIIILGPIYGNGNLGNKWAPQVIKCVYGAIVGWITNPVIALLALGSQADHHLVVVEHDPELGQSIDQGVETIHEQEELTTSPSRHIAPPSPGISLRGVSNTPRMGRTRAESTSSRISNRPPFTTNVSHLSPLPTPQMLPPSPSPNNVTRTRGNSYTIPQRPRGMTVSSYSSNRSYSYALGGTGGRAQRPRAASRATITGVPTLVLPTSRKDQADNPGTNLTAPIQSRGPEKTAAWDVFGRNEPAPSLARPVHARQRSQSAAPAVKSQDEKA